MGSLGRDLGDLWLDFGESGDISKSCGVAGVHDGDLGRSGRSSWSNWSSCWLDFQDDWTSQVVSLSGLGYKFAGLEASGESLEAAGRHRSSPGGAHIMMPSMPRGR